MKVSSIIVLYFFFFNIHAGDSVILRNIKTNHIADTIPQAAKKLINCYKDVVSGYAGNHLILRDGSKLLWNDGIKNKPFKLLLDKPDIKDMFSQKYLTGMAKFSPPANFDPGRIRNEPFFLKMYGSTEKEVKSNLTIITWCPKLVGQKNNGY